MPTSPVKVVVTLLCACVLVCAGDQTGVWLDVPFVKQEKNGCGAASIAMVMQFWQRQQGIELSADAMQIQRALYSREGHGIYASSLESYFREHGYQTFTFEGRADDLRQHLEKGRPLVVALKPSQGARLHYVVVAGLDEQNQLVLLNDPAQRKLLKQEMASFQKEWKGAGNWTLLAVPQSERASTAR